MAVAAIVDQESDDGADALDIRPVDDGAALPRRAQQAGAHQDGQMRRKRIVRRTDRIGDHPGGDADRFMPHQQTKDGKARRLRQRGQSRDRMLLGERTPGRGHVGMARNREHGFPHRNVLNP